MIIPQGLNCFWTRREVWGFYRGCLVKLQNEIYTMKRFWTNSVVLSCHLSFVAVSNFCSRQQLQAPNKIVGRGWEWAAQRGPGWSTAFPLWRRRGSWSVYSQRNLFYSFALNVGRWLSCLCAWLRARSWVVTLSCSVILLKCIWAPGSYSLVPHRRQDFSQMWAGNRLLML